MRAHTPDPASIPSVPRLPESASARIRPRFGRILAESTATYAPAYADGGSVTSQDTRMGAASAGRPMQYPCMAVRAASFLRNRLITVVGVRQHCISTERRGKITAHDPWRPPAGNRRGRCMGISLLRIAYRKPSKDRMSGNGRARVTAGIPYRNLRASSSSSLSSRSPRSYQRYRMRTGQPEVAFEDDPGNLRKATRKIWTEGAGSTAKSVDSCRHRISRTGHVRHGHWPVRSAHHYAVSVNDELRAIRLPGPSGIGLYTRLVPRYLLWRRQTPCVSFGTPDHFVRTMIQL